jgi:hypothetical protein
MPDYRALAQALGTSQPTPQEIERMVAEQSPAFGVFPQMKPYRSQQDITASANVPVDVLRGRIAGTRGLFGDVVNQPIPMVRPLQLLSQAFTGQQKYPDTEHYLETMPLKSNTPIGDVAGKIGSFAPINPMPAVKGYLSLLGNEINAGMTGQPTRSVIGQMTPKPLQIFIGENAKTWDKVDAVRAQAMEKKGATPEEIWTETGTFRGPEGKWRQEISDQNLGIQDFRNTGGAMVIKHPELQASYEQLPKGVKVVPTPEYEQMASYEAPKRELDWQLGEGGTIRVPTNEPAPTDVYAHELQHAVQAKEGFARGGSPDKMILVLEDLAKQKREEAIKFLNLSSNKDPLNPQIIKPGAREKGLVLQKEARQLEDQIMLAYHSEQAKFDLYNKLAGEAEARATQARLGMTTEQRRAKFPYQSYDVPINELIVRKYQDGN